MNFGKKIPTRDGFGDEIVALGKENENILVVDADIGKSCKTGAGTFFIIFSSGYRTSVDIKSNW